MATLEAQAMQDCHVAIVNATKNSCTSITGDLFGESLITEDVKMGMPPNAADQEKADRLVDSVRTQVASAPEKINVFIKVLRRHGGEEAAKKLEEQILLLKEKETSATNQAKALPKPSLPNKSNFPHLKTDGLTKNERDDLLTKLMEDYDMIRQEFACLVHSTLQSLKSQNTTLEELEVAVKTYLPQSRVHTLFSGAKSLNDMFLEDLFEYWSFFDYELLAFIIKNQCKELQADLNEYIKVFKEYCKRKVSEVPTDFNSKAGRRFLYNLVVKIKEEFDHITMEQVKEVERQLRNITGLDLSLSRVGDGCIELAFISLSGELPLSAHDKEELYEMGILKLYSANCVYYDRGESSPSGAQSSYPGKLLPDPNISKQEIELIAGAVKESDKVEDLAATLGMSDCLEDVNGDIWIFLQRWQEKADAKRSHLLYHLARIGMQDLHENLLTTESELLIENGEMRSELESLRQTVEENDQEIAQIKNELQQEKLLHQQTIEGSSQEIIQLKTELQEKLSHQENEIEMAQFNMKLKPIRLSSVEELDLEPNIFKLK